MSCPRCCLFLHIQSPDGSPILSCPSFAPGAQPCRHAALGVQLCILLRFSKWEAEQGKEEIDLSIYSLLPPSHDPVLPCKQETRPSGTTALAQCSFLRAWDLSGLQEHSLPYHGSFLVLLVFSSSPSLVCSSNPSHASWGPSLRNLPPKLLKVDPVSC